MLRRTAKKSHPGIKALTAITKKYKGKAGDDWTDSGLLSIKDAILAGTPSSKSERSSALKDLKYHCKEDHCTDDQEDAIRDMIKDSAKPPEEKLRTDKDAMPRHVARLVRVASKYQRRLLS
jgi:hypothetical protein